MKIAIVGLGKMGANMAQRLMNAGHEIVAFDVDPANVAKVVAMGADGADSLAEMVFRLPEPRAVWVMVPCGDITEKVIMALGDLLGPNDVVIDGGNSYYQDDIRRAALLKSKGIHFIDAGTSGGIKGLERGYSLMIGGAKEPVERLTPIFAALAPGRGNTPLTPGREGINSTAELGYLHCGSVGAGHFVKMIHNGIEYGMMQAYAEGFEILQGAGATELAPELRYDLDCSEIAELWRRGSIIGSTLLDLTAEALVEDPQLDSYSGYVTDSGEGRWAMQAAIDESVPAPVLAAALFARFRSRRGNTYSEKVLSAMRKKFGGHVEPVKQG